MLLPSPTSVLVLALLIDVFLRNMTAGPGVPFRPNISEVDSVSGVWWLRSGTSSFYFLAMRTRYRQPLSSGLFRPEDPLVILALVTSLLLLHALTLGLLASFSSAYSRAPCSFCSSYNTPVSSSFAVAWIVDERF